MTNDLRIDLGSVSKMMTAITVLKLADLGLIDLNAPFTSYLNPQQFPPSEGSFTD